MANHQADPLTRRRPRRRSVVITSYVITAGAAVTVILLSLWVVSGSGPLFTAANWVIRALYVLFLVLLGFAFRVRRRGRGRHAPRQ